MSSEQRTIFIANQETPDKPIVFIGIDETVCIGRDPATCAILLPAGETTISRTHCSITCKLNNNGEPSLVLTDKSSFGTNVNGKRMQKRGQRALKFGDSISVGEQHKFVVREMTLPPAGSRKRALSQRNSSAAPTLDGSATAVAPAADGADVTAVNREAIGAQEGVGPPKRPKIEPLSQFVEDSSSAIMAPMVVDDDETAGEGDGAEGGDNAEVGWLSSCAFQRPDLRQSQNDVAPPIEVKQEEEAMDSYPQSSQDWTVDDDAAVGRRLQEAFEFVDLVKKDPKPERASQNAAQLSSSTVNFKKFKKAHQGACARPDTLPVIVGISDMADFRSLPRPS
uniref:FHA domain-containing protein n=1 Tax=Plectus sambesii TaxID=2011161 RepID=A0A914XHI7_9BILA